MTGRKEHEDLVAILSSRMECSADPFLMAVAVWASNAWLTPIGHQSNTLVMVLGRYKFGDYWRVWLPVSISVVACSVPKIPGVARFYQPRSHRYSM